MMAGFLFPSEIRWPAFQPSQALREDLVPHTGPAQRNAGPPIDQEVRRDGMWDVESFTMLADHQLVFY